MAGSCRFAFALHILAVLACQKEAGATSNVIAASIATNPVVVRRLLTVLRKRGLITTRKGAGAGSRLSRAPSEISLDEVYGAAEPAASSLVPSRKANRRCPIARQMDVILRKVSERTEAAVQEALSGFTLEDILSGLADASPPARRGQVRSRKTA